MADNRIVVVDMDNNSVKLMGGWHHSKHSSLVQASDPIMGFLYDGGKQGGSHNFRC